MKNALKVRRLSPALLPLAFFLFAAPAFAYTSPSVNFVKVNNDPPRFQCDDYPSSPPTDCNAVLNNFASDGATIYVYGGSDFDGTYTVTSHGTAGDNTSLTVSPAPPQHSAGSYAGAIFSTTPYVPPPVPPANTLPDPTALIANVTTGVTSTGAALWPLFSLVGIYIAFYLAYLLVNFIRQSLGKKKTEGYYHMKNGGLERDADQDLGRHVYEVQETGRTVFEENL